MEAFWIVPQVVVLVGLAAIVVLLRSIDQAGTEVRSHLRQLDEVHRAVALVRIDAAAARASLEDLGQR